MSFINNISIKNKLILVQLFTGVIVLGLCISIFILLGVKEYKERKIVSMNAIAQIIGSNSISSLQFLDKETANNNLTKLSLQPDILNACILDGKGNIIASYSKNTDEIVKFNPIPFRENKIEFVGQNLLMYNPIYKERKFYGTVCLKVELSQLREEIYMRLWIGLFILFFGISLTLLIANFVQRYISEPFLNLVSLMREVRENNDYNKHLAVLGTDEISVLSSEFNDMLEQVEKTQTALKINNLTLEERVKERTADLQKIQATLEHNKEKYRKIVDEVGELIYSSDYMGNFTYINPICLRLTGYPENELIGKHFTVLVAPEWKEKTVKFYKEQFDKKIKETFFSFPIITKSGEKKWVEQTIIQNVIGDRVTGYQGVVRDVTERVKVEEELSETKERFWKIFEENSILMVIADLETFKFEFVNEAFLSKFGFTREEVIGKSSIELNLIDPEPLEKLAVMLKEKGKVKDFETIVRKKNGEPFWTLSSVSIINIGGKNSILSGFYDITEKKKSEEELNNSNERFLKIFDKNPTGLALSNVETREFTNVNQAFIEIYGYTKEEIIGKKGEDLRLLTPEDQLKIRDILKERGKINNMEIFVRNKNGAIFWVLFSLEMIIINNKKYALTSVLNISDRKKAEAIIQQKSDELAETNKEIEQFVYVASHDLQEPLRTISNFVSLVEKKKFGNLDKDYEQYLHFIVDAASRMRNLIKDLLDLSRTGKNIVFTEVDCNAVLKEVIANLEASIKEKNAKITVAKLPVLKGDPVKLRQLFQNLISNSIKFVKKGVQPEITITSEEKNEEYLFAIKDNGIGIDEQFFNKLFVIFQRLNSGGEYPGTGIGLATCKKIVNLHNGKIWVESKVGEGSTFYFTISKKL